MSNIIIKFLSSFLILIFIGLSSSVPLHLHKCLNKKISYVSILVETKCEHNQVNEECCSELDDTGSSACHESQNFYFTDENGSQSTEIKLFGSLSCCSNQKFSLRLPENLIYQNPPPYQSIKLSFECIPFSIFRNLENIELKKFANNNLFHSYPRKLLLKFIQISSRNKNVDDLPPLVS
ncbi:MAG: hypothetical protein ACUVQ1_02340 [Candidatus Kapaibacteriales bacterium]